MKEKNRMLWQKNEWSGKALFEAVTWKLRPKGPKGARLLAEKGGISQAERTPAKGPKTRKSQHLGRLNHIAMTTVGIWGSLLPFLFIKYSLITSTVLLRINNLSFLVSRIHHLEFPSLKMWTFAILCVPQMT